MPFVYFDTLDIAEHSANSLSYLDMKCSHFLVILRNFIATVILLRIKPHSTVKVLFNPIALRKSKIVYNFGLSECNWVNGDRCNMGVSLQKLPLIRKSVLCILVITYFSLTKQSHNSRSIFVRLI